MGIKGLMPFISDHAPLAIKETEMKSLTGRTIAIDACAPRDPPRTVTDRLAHDPPSLPCAAMSLYQFIVAVRQGDSQTNLTNDAGEVTSHIQGFLSRTVKLMELDASTLAPTSSLASRLHPTPHPRPHSRPHPSGEDDGAGHQARVRLRRQTARPQVGRAGGARGEEAAGRARAGGGA